jgi:hypothetical protein
MKSTSLPPLPHKRSKSAPSNNNQITQQQPGRSGQVNVRKGSYLDEDSLEISKTYFKPAAIIQPVRPNVQKPSFSPKPPTSKPEDAINQMYKELQRAGRYGSRSLMLSSQQDVSHAGSQAKVTLEVTSKEEVATRDLAWSAAQSSSPDNKPQLESKSELGIANEKSNEDVPQSDPEVACGIIKEGDL